MRTELKLLWAVLVALGLCLAGCDDGAQVDDAGTTADAGNTLDAGSNPDAGQVADAGTDPDAGPVDAGANPDAGSVSDAGTDAGIDVDAGFDAGSDPDAGFTADAGLDAGIDAGLDAGTVVDAGPVDAGPPIPELPYEATPAVVTATTTSVATLPRPAHITVPTPTGCPHLQSGLTAWDPSWVSSNGVVDIPVGARVLVRGNLDIPSTTRLRALNVPATSELIFDDRASTFLVTDIRVAGALRLGSPTCRLQSQITFIFDTDELVADAGVREAIVGREGLGLVVELGGELSAFGRLFQPTWTRLAQTAPANANTVVLSETVDWEPGQKVVVVTSSQRDYPYASENEVRTITAVNGATVTLDAPLAYLHYGGPEYQVEVGLLSRSIAFRTSSAVLAAAPGFGGHIMIEDAKAQVSGVELEGLGQQNFVGRYPFHFHYADSASQSYFNDGSVWRSNWRGVVIHHTNDTVVSRNVAFDVFGHCFYLEDGTEFRNELSFNLAAGIKIMGPTDVASINALNTYDQAGFFQVESSALTQPADRAAAGFYLPNGNNRIIGNAASGGFAGFSFPSVPAVGDVVPLEYGASHFDGNSVHTSAYFWDKGGCVYAGGVLSVIDVGGVQKLQYQSGRTTDWNLLRHTADTFNNTKTFLCTIGITHWGSEARVVNFEAWDDELMGQLFGAASIQSAISVGRTAHTPSLTWGLFTGFRRGFQFYDTGTQTILSDVVFRNYQTIGGTRGIPNQDNCALLTMTHSDQYTPQKMNATQRLFFDSVQDPVRLCLDNTGTLSSRNFNLYDADGSATRASGDGLPAGPRLVGSGFIDSWKISSSCVRNNTWNLWMCPIQGDSQVASIGTVPNRGVRATMYGLTGTSLGENWYSTTSDFIEAQLTGPAGIGWHHSFPGGVPASFNVQVLQVPAGNFAILSFSLPPGVACSVTGQGWQGVSTLAALLSNTGSAYTTDRGTCFVRIAPTYVGFHQASGLSIPGMTWRGNPTPTTYFTVNTGCTSANAACATLVSTLPVLP